jgi:CubicO group peptidase (beta-lactamase class C family)
MVMGDSVGSSRRGFVQSAGLVTAGLGVSSVVGTARAGAATAAPTGLNLHPPAVNPTTQLLVAIPADRVANAVGFLDDIIGQVMAVTGVPGLAASVVHQGQLLYAEGFGVRDIDTGGPVDAKTVFHLASVSKSLSSTVVAGLVGHRVVQWADPIVSHLPDFALSVPYVTDNVS